MTLNERILDFLDGSLPADDEAELLHTLSVSPEKRGLLRGFMEQRSLFTRDAKSLPVPYAAEQRLWARMDRVLPASSAMRAMVNEEAPTVFVPVEAPGFFARAFNGAASSAMRATVGAFTLVAGIGIGYFAGHSRTAITPQMAAAPMMVAQASPILSKTSDLVNTHPSDQTYRSNRTNRTTLNFAPTLPPPVLNESTFQISPAVQKSDTEPAPITPIAETKVPAIMVAADIGGDGVGIKPMLHHVRPSREANPSFLSRFEFRIDESFGRQFPNNVATNVSLPLITNSSITTFFQVFPHSNLFWAGASYGSANITRKDLFTRAGDPIDPSQEVLASDTVHSQTSYIAGVAELRLPAFETTDMTFTAGYGLASLGQMMFGEIGLHYDVSSQAGIQCGLRVLRFTYDLSAEKASVIGYGNSSLAISNEVAASSPSFNTEFNMGLFFHF